ncbi:MAG: DnaD domain protein [Lachnospiraceae bacterium]|nr:DnaD domain protein [Lachnospiraceae bacterium]
MKNIALYEKSNLGTTAIANDFIDIYLKDANEAQIKVYLYLLRFASAANPVSVTAIADLFNYAERDIIRALEYWDRQGLLSLDYDENRNIRGICMNILPLTGKNEAKKENAQPVRKAEPVSAPAASEITGEVKSEAEDEIKGITKPFYAKDKIEEFKNREDVSELVYLAERYLGRLLNSSDLNTLLFIYDKLGFNVELIEYLVDYCVSNDHKNMHYIESTAIKWHEQGVTDIASAKAQTSVFNKDYFAVLRSFGLSGRNPVKNEVDYIRRWKEDFGFDMEIIIEAVNRTMKAIARPSFRYADKILSEWRKKGAKSMTDIERIDAEHLRSRDKAASHTAAAPRPADKFHNFEERTYNYDELEKRFVKN